MGIGTKSGTSCESRGVLAQMLCRCLPIIFLTCLTLSTLAPAEAEAQTYRFGSVRVEGNTRVDGATIVNYAGIARGRSVSAGQLNDAFTGAPVFENVCGACICKNNPGYSRFHFYLRLVANTGRNRTGPI